MNAVVSRDIMVKIATTRLTHVMVIPVKMEVHVKWSIMDVSGNCILKKILRH